MGETENGRLRQVYHAVGRQISWSRSRYAGGREIEGENIGKNDGRARRWSPFTGGRLAEVVARAGSTVSAFICICQKGDDIIGIA